MWLISVIYGLVPVVALGGTFVISLVTIILRKKRKQPVGSTPIVLLVISSSVILFIASIILYLTWAFSQGISFM